MKGPRQAPGTIPGRSKRFPLRVRFDPSIVQFSGERHANGTTVRLRPILADPQAPRGSREAAPEAPEEALSLEAQEGPKKELTAYSGVLQ